MPTSSRIRTYIAAALVLAFVPLFAAAPAADGVMDKTRLQTMLVDGDTSMVAATFRRRPGQTLPFIDGYLEGGLKMIEKGGDGAKPEALNSYRTAIKFAKVADEAFSTTVFSRYATAFASWSPSEQKSFREGQRLFRAGMKAAKDDPKAGLAMLRESLALAAPLGDLWGEAMAHQGIAEVSLKVDDAEHKEDAMASSSRAVKLYSQLFMVDDWAQALQLRVAALRAMGADSSGVVNLLQDAWNGPLAMPGADAALVRTVGLELASAMDEAKIAGGASIRRDVERRAPEAPKPTPPAGEGK
ncbi:MAG: hypothetical protein SGJ11_07235 [Phycisphaerae bacterium]|nr:hypothetical protein [Phycisphaerae bacterium]